MVSSYRPLLRFKTPTDNPGHTFYSTVTEGITYFTNDQIMSSNQQNQQSRSKGEPSGSSKDSSKPKSDEWTDVKDPNERRKIQNKLAQRRFRDKVREQKEESEREAENQRRAGASYATPEPRDIASSSELSGLPWGGISMRHIVETGKSKEQSSRQGSRENSVYGSSSR